VLAAGVDVGSTTSKAVIIDDDRRIVGTSLLQTGANVVRAAESAFREALRAARAEDTDVGFVVGTGYGRYKIHFGDAQVTEISCHARGAKTLYPGTRTIIDIGGQDTKAILVAENGDVVDFCMNDKCAAGTGRFLESAAAVLDIPMDELGPLSLSGQEGVQVTNVCTVFVESEIMSHLAAGRKMEDILRAVHSSIASRTIALARRVGTDPEITFTGGVSKNIGMVQGIEQRLGTKLNVHAQSQHMGALGAAIYAMERAERGGREMKERTPQEVAAQ